MDKVKLPVIFRRKYYRDEKKWELFAVFPTLPAESANWYGMQAEAENGDTFSCNWEFWNSSRNVYSGDFNEAVRLQSFKRRIYKDWQSDKDFPCELVEYSRISSRMQHERESAWRKSRVA